MTTKDILNQMEKEFDEKFVYGEKWKTYREGNSPSMYKPKHIKSFIRSYIRTLLESFGEEIIGEEKEDKFYSPGEIEVYNGVVRNILRAEQRLKVKEILQNIT